MPRQPLHFISSSRILEYSLYVWAIFLPLSKTVPAIALIIAIIAFFVKKFTPSLPESNKKKISWVTQLLPWTPMNKLIGIFLIYGILSLGWGYHPYENLRGLNKYVQDFLIFYLLIDTLRSQTTIHKFLNFLILGALVSSLNGIFQYFVGIDLIRGHLYEIRINSTFHVAPFFSSYLGMIIPLSLYYCLENPKRKNHVFISIFCFLSITFFLTLTRNTLSCLILVSFFIILFNKSYDIFYKYVLVIGSLMLLLFFGGPHLFKTFQMFLVPSKNTSIIERIHLWNIAKSMVEKKPILGHGLNSYSKIHKDYFPVSPEGMLHKANYLHLAYPHNSYLKIWIESGLIGLFLYALIFFSLFSFLYFNFRKGSLLLRWKLYLYLISITTFLISSLFAEFLVSTQTRATFWTILGLLMAELQQVNFFKQSSSIFEADQKKDVLKVLTGAQQT